MIITLVAGGGPLGVVVAVALAGVLADLVGTNVFFNGVVLKLDLLVIKGADGAGGGFCNNPGVPVALPNIITDVLDLHLIADELELQPFYLQ